MHLCAFEDDRVDHLLPLVFTRAVYDLRLGARTILETLRDAFPEALLALHARALVADVTAHAHDVTVNRLPSAGGVLFVNGRWVPEAGDVLTAVRSAMREREARMWVQGDVVVAAWLPPGERPALGEAVTRETFDAVPAERVDGVRMIDRLWDLTAGLQEALVRDFEAHAAGKPGRGHAAADIRDGARLVASERIALGQGAAIAPGAVLNAEGGPILVGPGAKVMENAVVRGPCYIGPRAEIKPAAVVEGSAIGYWSKVGGEVHESVLHSLSSKAHAGYLGNSYLGRWCNLGADTNTSNLKNDYGPVSIYDYAEGDFVASGQQFLGLVMGDHAKCGINTMFNTGTVVGVFCNLYGAGFPPRHVPSFSWGGPDGLTPYRLDKAFRVAEAVQARRNRTLTPAERENLRAVAEREQPGAG